MKCKAHVDGELVNGVIRVANLELLPVEPGSASAQQQVSQNDVR